MKHLSIIALAFALSACGGGSEDVDVNLHEAADAPVVTAVPPIPELPPDPMLAGDKHENAHGRGHERH